MKPPPFVYLAPDTLGEAVDTLREHGTDGKILAGGQSLVPMMNMRLARPEVLVDIGRIPELSGIRANGRIAIGAGTRQAAVLRDGDVGARFPLVHTALKVVGHAANRARGTFGGSIAHADPAAELPAVVVALGAELVVHGPGGERVISADEFFVTHYTTVLEVDDVLTAVRLPERSPSAWAFGEVSRRQGDFALAGVALTAETDGHGTVTAARIALFGVSDRPVRATAAENSLIGQRLGDEAAASEAARLAPDGVEFASDIHVPEAYRREAAAALVARAVRDAANTLEG